jgi:PAS domain S-box-containing protein
MVEEHAAVTLGDLLDISAFQDLLDSFSRLTGAAAAIVSLKGEILVASGWKKICTEFHRKNAVTASRCLESDTVLAGRAARGEQYSLYQCNNGLVDVAVPIKIGNAYAGNLFVGQFLMASPDLAFFARQAEEFGFDKDAYLEALSEVPVLSIERINDAIEFLTNLTTIVGNTGLDKKRLFELNSRLEQRIQERTAELTYSSERLRVLSEASFEGITLTENGVVIETNERMSAMLGFQQPIEMIGIKITNFIAPDKREDVERKISSGYQEPYETLGLRKNGAIFPIEVRGKTFSYQGRLVRGTAIRDITERKQADAAINKYSKELKERNKELNCLYSISELIRRTDLAPERILQECSHALSQAYQSPETTACQITWGDREYNTENFRKTPWIQECPIMVHGEQAGTIRVCYLEEKPEESEGPFLAEERKLLNSVADLLGRSAERKQAKDEREKLIIELQEALGRVKTLSGFLPICASCKKIRNDKGYWEQLEAYITKHSEALFSHGLCPECAQKLCPQIYEQK